MSSFLFPLRLSSGDIKFTLEEGICLEQKALDRAWSYLAAKNYLVQCLTMRSPDKTTLEECSSNLGQAFEKVEHIVEGPFFKGETLSIVDIAGLPLLHRAALIEKHTCYDLVARYPKVMGWQTALLESGLLDRSVSDDFEQVFTGFYLTDKTYLGQGHNCEVDI